MKTRSEKCHAEPGWSRFDAWNRVFQYTGCCALVPGVVFPSEARRRVCPLQPPLKMLAHSPLIRRPRRPPSCDCFDTSELGGQISDSRLARSPAPTIHDVQHFDDPLTRGWHPTAAFRGLFRRSGLSAELLRVRRGELCGGNRAKRGEASDTSAGDGVQRVLRAALKGEARAADAAAAAFRAPLAHNELVAHGGRGASCSPAT